MLTLLSLELDSFAVSSDFVLSICQLYQILFQISYITQLKKEVPQLERLGSSNAHNLANAMMHAVTSCDPDMKDALVNLFQDIVVVHKRKSWFT